MATRQLPRRLLVVLLVIPCLLFAQVTIKEKVEIQPALKDTVTVTPEDSICPPRSKLMKVAESGTSFEGSIQVPANNYIYVKWISSSTVATIDLNIDCPFLDTTIHWANQCQGAVWQTEFITQPTTISLSIYWYLPGRSGPQYGVHQTDLGDGRYLFAFEDAGSWDPNSLLIDYDDLVMEVEVKHDENLDHFTLYTLPDSINFNEEYAAITGYGFDQEGNLAVLGQNAQIALTADPNNIGTFYPTNVCSYQELK